MSEIKPMINDLWWETTVAARSAIIVGHGVNKDDVWYDLRTLTIRNSMDVADAIGGDFCDE